MYAQLFGAAVVAMTLSLDALAVSFAYGCKKIKIPWVSALIINFICTGVLGIAFLFGSVIYPFIPTWVATMISFAILFAIGLVKLLDSITKSLIRKYSQFSKEINLSILNFKFLLRLYADPEEADIDISRSLDSKEAVLLAIPVSLDGFAVGFGAALLGFNGWAIFLFSFFTNGLALLIGSGIGNKTAHKLPFNISWSAGIILIILAIMQLTNL